MSISHDSVIRTHEWHCYKFSHEVTASDDAGSFGSDPSRGLSGPEECCNHNAAQSETKF